MTKFTASELLAQSAGPFDAACVEVLKLEKERDSLIAATIQLRELLMQHMTLIQTIQMYRGYTIENQINPALTGFATYVAKVLEGYPAILLSAIEVVDIKQLPPNENWCIGCDPDNCSGCGTHCVKSKII